VAFSGHCERKRAKIKGSSVIAPNFYKIGDLAQTISTSIAALVVLVCLRKLGRKNKELKLLIFQHAPQRKAA